jgi:hypothetical protein
MTVVFAVVLVVHGLIHLLGFAKSFGLAELPQLTHPIPASFGVLWLAACVLFVAAAGAMWVWPRGWWAIGACAIGVSMTAIGFSWADAKVGALGNLCALVGVVLGFLVQGPMSLRAEYDRDVERRLAQGRPADAIGEADLLHLPDPVQRYLRTAGVVGRPRVRNFRVRMHGRIRSGPDARWMPIAAEQHSFVGEPARLFYLTGSMVLVPVHGFHRYAAAAASMRVKAAGLVTVVDASGEAMDESETVTMFNDLCVMAPAALVDRAVAWEAVDAATARARYTAAGRTIRAELSFNDAGELTDFRSDDRFQIASDGRARQVRWSTPLGGYRAFGGVRLASTGEGRWHEPEGQYSYIELTIDDVQYNVVRP